MSAEEWLVLFLILSPGLQIGFMIGRWHGLRVSRYHFWVGDHEFFEDEKNAPRWKGEANQS